MTRDELLAELAAERFGPLPSVLQERQTMGERRHRELAAAFWLPAQVLAEVRADVAALAGHGWSAEQIAAVLGVPVWRVRRVLPRDEGGEAA